MHPDLVDIGLNLGNPRFDADRAALIERARQAGVTRMILTGTHVEESTKVKAMAEELPGVLFSTAGVHPHDASTCDASTIDALRALAQSPSVVAIGECGLDFNRDFSPRPTQEHWFEQQIALALEQGMPLFLHERDASERFLAILDASSDVPPRGVVHCFTGGRAAMEAYLERGLYIGITGWICDERRGTELQTLVQHIPLSRILVETDAPYLVPRDMRPRPKRNEPSFLPHIVGVIAHHMGCEPRVLAQASSANAAELFGLSPRTAESQGA